MNKLIGIAVGVMILGMVATARGEDCPGTPWRSSGGRSCQNLGLDSQRGTCLPGDRYETRCDDSSQGIKTCRGPNRCQEEDIHWGRRYEREGYYRENRYLEDRYREDYDDRWQEPCYWDFTNNQPCPRGYINLDCKASCDSRDSGW